MDLSSWFRKHAEVQQQQEAGHSGGTSAPQAGAMPPVPPAQMLQTIQINLAALQRQWTMANTQPDGPNKTTAQQYLAGQMRRLMAMHEQIATQARDAQPPGASASPVVPPAPGVAQGLGGMGMPVGITPPMLHQGMAQAPPMAPAGSPPMAAQSAPGVPMYGLGQPMMPQMQPQLQMQMMQQQQMQMQQAQMQQAAQPQAQAPSEQAPSLVQPAQPQTLMTPSMQVPPSLLSAAPVPSHTVPMAAPTQGAPIVPLMPASAPQAAYSKRSTPADDASERRTASPHALPHRATSLGTGSPAGERTTPAPPTPGALQRDFVGAVQAFLAQRGVAVPPDFGAPFVAPAAHGPGETRAVDLQRLFAKVVSLGGSDHVYSTPNGWATVATQLDLAVGAMGEPSPPGALPTPGEVPGRLAAYYTQRLALFERSWLAAQRRPTPSDERADKPAPFANMEPAQVQAAMAQHMAQLQSMVAGGQLTPQQAMQRYQAVQQAVQVYHANVRARAASSAGEAPAAAQATPAAPAPAAPADPDPLRTHPMAQQALQRLQRGDLAPAQQHAALAMLRSVQEQSAGGAPARTISTVPGLQGVLQSVPVAPAPAAPTPAAPAPAAPTPAAPAAALQIEYLPTHIAPATAGGRDLDRLERELAPRCAARARVRGVHELGTVDVFALCMSLQSGLTFEVSYALNALLILSAGVDGGASYQLLLEPCEQLLDVLLDVLLEHAFESADAVHERLARDESGALDAAALQSLGVLCHDQLSYCDATELALQDEGAVRLPRSAHAERRAAVVQTVLVILRNAAVMPDNAGYLAAHARFLPVLALVARAAQLDPRWTDGARCDAAYTLRDLSLAELLGVRKDVLTVVLALSGEALDVSEHAPLTAATLLDTLRFFILDASEFEAREAPPLLLERLTAATPNAQAMLYQVPHHAHLALQALSCFALPDANREALARWVPSDVLVQLAVQLLRLLPVDVPDFRRLASASRLEYAEAAAFCLFHVVYMAPPAARQAIREAPGVVRILFRAAKRLLQNVRDYTHNPYGLLCRRLIETLRVLGKKDDAFGAPPLLGMYWPAVDDADTRGSAGAHAEARSDALLDEDDAVVDLLTGTANMDAGVAHELLALTSAC